MADENVFQNNKELNALYKKYGNDFVRTLTNELIKAGKKASGALIRSLKAEIKPVADVINIIIKGEDYLYNVDKGRKKGTYPPISEISKWCSIRGIPETAAFPIAKNIYKFGIPPTNVIEKSKNIFSGKPVKDLEKGIASIIEKEVAKRLKNKLK